MTALACITNVMQQDSGPRPHACMVRNTHLETCRDDDCWGCFPRAADIGCLCIHCYEKADNVLTRIGGMIVHLRSIENGGQALGEKVATSREPRLPVPESWLSADEMLVALGGPPVPATATLDETADIVAGVLDHWADLRSRVSSTDGARAAVHVTMIMQRALHRWPDAETERRAIPRPIRCMKCSARALYRYAPLDYLGDLYVECEMCGDRRDWWEWSQKTAVLADAVDTARKQEEKRRRDARRGRKIA